MQHYCNVLRSPLRFCELIYWRVINTSSPTSSSSSPSSYSSTFVFPCIMVATKLYVDGGGGQVVIRCQCDAVLKMSPNRKRGCLLALHKDLFQNARKCHVLTELEFRKCHGSESRVINRTHVQQEKEEKIPHRAAPFVCLENYPVVIRGHPVI